MNVKFPTNVSFPVRSKAEYDEFVKGLEAGVAALQEKGEDAVVFAQVVDRVRFHDDKGIVQQVAEAYVEVGARRVGEGTEEEMRALFSQEIAGHRATVKLFVRDGTKYKAIQTRQGQR